MLAAFYAWFRGLSIAQRRDILRERFEAYHVHPAVDLIRESLPPSVLVAFDALIDAARTSDWRS